MWFFKKRQDEPKRGTSTVAEVGWQGGEVRINPGKDQTLERNAARVKRLEAKLETVTDPQRRISLEAELASRRRFLPREG